VPLAVVEDQTLDQPRFILEPVLHLHNFDHTQIDLVGTILGSLLVFLNLFGVLLLLVHLAHPVHAHHLVRANIGNLVLEFLG